MNDDDKTPQQQPGSPRLREAYTLRVTGVNKSTREFGECRCGMLGDGALLVLWTDTNGLATETIFAGGSWHTLDATTAPTKL